MTVAQRVFSVGSRRSLTPAVAVSVAVTTIALRPFRGFKHVRTLDLADYPSGALFQRPATDWRGRKTSPALAEKPQTLPTRQNRFEPFERALWPVLNEAVT